MSNKTNTTVRDQYENWVYPDPIKDLGQFARSGGIIFGNPSEEFHNLWPDRTRFAPTILVPGCGANLAAVIAQKNPESRVIGIDISESSLANSERLKRRHKLDNLELFPLNLFEVESLKCRFDCIIVTGVLHHLEDPIAGGKILLDALAERGVMLVMHYGMALRIGVYMLQKAFRLVGLQQNEEGVAAVRATLGRLPEKHVARRYIDAADELKYDGAIVDTFLHPQDRAYSADEIYQYAEDIGAQFQAWLDRGRLNPISALGSDHPLLPAIMELSERKRSEVVDLLRQSEGTHRFLLRRRDDPKDYLVDFGSEEFWSWIPHKHPRLKYGPSKENLGAFTLRRDRRSIDANALVAAFLSVIDSKRTVQGCYDELIRQGAQRAPDSEMAIRSVAKELYELGHIFVDKSATP